MVGRRLDRGRRVNSKTESNLAAAPNPSTPSAAHHRGRHSKRAIGGPAAGIDHPYAGTLIVTRADKDLMRQLCPKTALAVTLGCAFPSAKECWIILARTKPTTESLSKTRALGFATMVLVLLDHTFGAFCNNGCKSNGTQTFHDIAV